MKLIGSRILSGDSISSSMDFLTARWAGIDNI